jgi:hypothetical protein
MLFLLFLSIFFLRSLDTLYKLIFRRYVWKIRKILIKIIFAEEVFLNDFKGALKWDKREHDEIISMKLQEKLNAIFFEGEWFILKAWPWRIKMNLCTINDFNLPLCPLRCTWGNCDESVSERTHLRYWEDEDCF